MRRSPKRCRDDGGEQGASLYREVRMMPIFAEGPAGPAEAAWQLMLTYLAVAAGCLCLGLAAAATLLAFWQKRKRSDRAEPSAGEPA
jgi:hypothetical protein